MQEGDVQIKGYPVRLALDVLLVFTANPEDYTARGKIITPLKDRIGSEIRTHYPATVAEGMSITAQESWTERDNTKRVEVPQYIREIVEEVAFQAREDKRVDRRSGVSQRLPISTLENVLSSAEQRAVRSRDSAAVARVADVYAAIPSMTGKFELEYEGELRGAENIARELIRAAVGKTYTQYFTGANMQPVIQWFELGGELKDSRERVQLRGTGTAEENSGPLRQFERAGSQPEGRRRNRGQRGGIHSRRTLGAQAHQPQRRARVISPTGARLRSRAIRGSRRAAAAPAVQLKRIVMLSRSCRGSYEITRYSKYAPNAADDIDLQELMSRLSDFFLQSGFESQFGIYEMDPERSREQMMDELREAILRALQEGDLLPPELMEQMLQNPDLFAEPGIARRRRSDYPAHGRGRIHFAPGPARAGHAASFADSRRAGGRGAAERGSAL